MMECQSNWSKQLQGIYWKLSGAIKVDKKITEYFRPKTGVPYDKDVSYPHTYLT